MTYRELVQKLEGLDDLRPMIEAIEIGSLDPDVLFWDITEGGMCGDQVMAWPTEQDSENDDGQRALVRVELEALT